MKKLTVITGMLLISLVPLYARVQTAFVSDASGSPGSTVTVTVRGSSIPAGTISMDLWLTYDATLLQAASVAKSALISTSGWSMAPNVNQAGIVKIGLYNTAALTATKGDLAVITFVVQESAASGASCALHLTNATFNTTAARAIDGTFKVPITYTLGTVAVNGSITKSPDKTRYNAKEHVILTAVPAANYSFTSWSGDAKGKRNPVTVRMTTNKTVTANFVESQR